MCTVTYSMCVSSDIIQTSEHDGKVLIQCFMEMNQIFYTVQL